MASIQERRDKDGKLISYSIRVHRGRGADGKQLKPWTATFEVSPTWTEKGARKRAESFAATFEEKCKAGVLTDTRITFQEYADYVLDLKQRTGLKHSTYVRYKELTTRIYPALGHIKLKDLRADHLNSFYGELLKKGERKNGGVATAKIDLEQWMKKHKITRLKLAELSGVGPSTVGRMVNGQPVSVATADKIAAAMGMKTGSIFKVLEDTRPLSGKTVAEHHRFMSTVLEQAVREGLVPFNVASRATPPKMEQHEPNYFQPEQVAAIRDALETEPILWKVLVHLFLITGARRGEILGLKWANVDFDKNQIYICNNLLYSPDVGIYETAPKTKRSQRYISLPKKTMQLLRQYKIWQIAERLRLGEYFDNRDYVFARDDGKPIHPNSLANWLRGFSSRHGLPHINPHAFRHTMASMLYFNGVDTISISARLGHAQPSTTANLYAHVIEASDQRNADILADMFLKKA